MEVVLGWLHIQSGGFCIEVSCIPATEQQLPNLMYIGLCIIVIVEEQETNLMSLVIMFYFTSSMLNMFQTLTFRRLTSTIVDVPHR